MILFWYGSAATLRSVADPAKYSNRYQQDMAIVLQSRLLWGAEAFLVVRTKNLRRACLGEKNLATELQHRFDVPGSIAKTVYQDDGRGGAFFLYFAVDHIGTDAG